MLFLATGLLLVAKLLSWRFLDGLTDLWAKVERTSMFYIWNIDIPTFMPTRTRRKCLDSFSESKRVVDCGVIE